MQYHAVSGKQAPLRRFRIAPRISERAWYVLKHLIILFLLLMLMGLVQTATAAEPDYMNISHGTLFYRAADDGKYHAAPLLKTNVQMHVTGLINRAKLLQVFHNGSNQWVEGIYVFPLPTNAAVDHMRIRIGKRVIEGVIKKRSRARQVYEQAKQAGKQTSLIEQERPNLFTTSLANIGPHQSISVEIEYQQTLVYDQGKYSLRLPLAITPRYIPGNRQASDNDSSLLGHAAPTAQVPDADRITPRVALQKINPVSIHIDLDAGFALGSIKSPYFPIKVTHHDKGRYSIDLADGAVPSDHDFELDWRPRLTQVPQVALFRQRLGNENYYLGMLLPPMPDKNTVHTLPREVIYVIDTSGSMGGVSIRQARSALILAIKHLRAQDYFNVIQFNSVTSSLFASPVPANLENKTQAMNYVSGLEAGGGTEMMGAMRQALAVQTDTTRLCQVIFLTDGAVGNEDALFTYIKRHLGASRLFTVGIGAAPNSHFMTKAAQFGRGTYTYIGRVSEVADKMKALFNKLDSPVMRDLVLKQNLIHFVMSPAHLPDLYVGEPIVFTARSDSTQGVLTLKGERRQKPWQLQLLLQQAQPGNGIAQLWARRRIAELLDSVDDGADAELVRQKVIALALRYHLVSKYTSLVAVDATAVRSGSTALTRLEVPVNLPQGELAAKIFGLQAQTGTAQYLYWLIGVFCLFMVVILHRLNVRRVKICTG